MQSITMTVPGTTNQLATFYPTGTGGGLFVARSLFGAAGTLQGSYPWVRYWLGCLSD